MKKQPIKILATDEERKCNNYSYCGNTTKNYPYFYWRPFNQIACGCCMQDLMDALNEVDHWG